MRLNPAVDLHINAFNGATITELDSGLTNAIVETRGGKTYITQRPSIDVTENADTHISDARGRAIYYWPETTSVYVVNNDNIYKGSQSNSISTALTAGVTKCHFRVLGTTLLVINPAGNELFTISNADSVAEVTDTDFPPKQTPAVPLAYGMVVLDNYVFVLGTNGIIYQSDSKDVTSWDALAFLEAERDPDAGVYIAKHHDNIVAFGAGTTEFFYDAANTAGSVLSRRQDVSYLIGCSSGQSVWEIGDRCFFLSVNAAGAINAHVLENFQLRKISTSTLDSFFTEAIVKGGYTAIGSGFSAQGHIFYTLTIGTVPSDFSPDITLVYDDTTGIWNEFDITVNSLSKFPLVDWSRRTGTAERFGEGLLTNGDFISLNDNLTPQDTLLASTYVTTGYVTTGYVAATGGVGTNIAIKSRFGQDDLGTNLHKYPMSYRQVADLTPTSQTLTLKWADEINTTFTSGKTLDTSKYQKAYRNGRFRRRNHEINYSGSDEFRLEAIEADIPTGDN